MPQARFFIECLEVGHLDELPVYYGIVDRIQNLRPLKNARFCPNAWVAKVLTA
jgi:hypothetical protein